MRSSKNRSRSKGNRNRSVGNIVNRVFDSSGPEGKVRGTPQQIIDKYNQLARDAQLSNDRVAAENFQQHAEHYLRMLAEAQREQDARQQQHQQGGGGRDRAEADERDGGGRDEGGYQPSHEQRGPDRAEGSHAQPDRSERADRPERAERPERRERGDFDKVIDAAPATESNLVETPENAPKPKRSRTRRPRKPEESGERGSGEQGGGDPSPDTPQEAAE